MKNPNNITNPKTIRRYEREKKVWDEKEKFAKERGYVIEKRSTNVWSFSKNGVKSVLGFDIEGDVVDFIFHNEPDADRIFPPYKDIDLGKSFDKLKENI